MVTKILHAKRGQGVQIYTGPRDEALEADPHEDITRVDFHTGLNYIVVRQKVTGTTVLTGTGYDSDGQKVYNVHEHGLGYTPLIFGMYLNAVGRDSNGPTVPGLWSPASGTVAPLPFSGSLMIPTTGTYNGLYLSHLVYLGVNGTYVTITDVSVYSTSFALNYKASYFDLPAITVEWAVWLTNYQLPGDDP